MEKLSIAKVKELQNNNQLTEEMIHFLKEDERKGIQRIVKAYEKQKQKEKQLETKFNDMTKFENQLYVQGIEMVAGVDEVGRGPLAGPVVAAAVILPKDFRLLGLDDSKKLSENDRLKFYSIIKEKAISHAVSIVSNEIIDEINILEATRKAMKNAIDQLEPRPNHILIDALELPSLSIPQTGIIKGDSRSVSIAAASVLAKVTRDQLMKEIHKEFPDYNFASNMGYGTKHHLEKLQELGATPYHRKSFAPVRESTERSLFTI